MIEQVSTATSFFERPGVQVEDLAVGPGIPLGIEQVVNAEIGLGGAYGAWGRAFDNEALPQMLAARLGSPLGDAQLLNLGELGFLSRHHIPDLTPEQHLELEVEVGTRFLRAAAAASGWTPDEVDAVIIGATNPVVPDYVARISRAAGIRADALKISVHKACDGAVAGLNLALNPELAVNSLFGHNLARDLWGKKVLVGGIEGLSRVMSEARDLQALQLFANGAGIIGLVPGRNLKFLAGASQEVYDVEGLLQVRMRYPHTRQRHADGSLTEVAPIGENAYAVGGLMHEPQDAGDPVVMAGPMGMVKLFVRSGVVAVRTAYDAYRTLMQQRGLPEDIVVAIAHHANYKINQLKGRQLLKEGIDLRMPWLLSDFGNVSAASAMIALLRGLSGIHPGDHFLIDGFGAGTYYDVLAVEAGGLAA